MKELSPRILKGIPKSFVTTATGKGNSNMRRARNMEMALLQHLKGMQVRIPAQFDAYLTQKYGNWRADLPEEEKVGHHYAEMIDLNHPFTDYIKID